MRKRNVVFATSVFVGIAGALSAQVNLNSAPSRAIGQPQLTLNTANPNLVEGREFFAPQAAALDTSVNPPVLYVSDLNNNRVLGWLNSTGFSFGQPADFVIGQKDFFSTARLGPGTPVSSGLYHPTGLAVDGSGNLYIIDAGNNRILRFPKPYAQTAQLPNLVIGQTSLNCATCSQANSGGSVSPNTIFVSNGGTLYSSNLAFDSQGNLWFTDSGNNRVLRYPASVLTASAANGPAADIVLGQTDFATGTQAQVSTANVQGKTALFNPSGVAFDPSGRLYVSDNYRVAVFPQNLQPTAGNGTAALRLMGIVVAPAGQNAPPAINAVAFSNPQSVFIVGAASSYKVGVVDSGNNRILVFPPFEQWPADGSSPSASGVIGQGGLGASPVFTTGKANIGLPEPSATSLAVPTFAAASGSELFVVDSGNNRLIVFPASGLGQSNAPATRVLGQDQFTFRAINLIEGREVNFVPGNGGADGGLIVDLVSSVPHLYIADTYNNRVLGYRDARTVRPGDKADIVIGQPDFQRSLINYPTNNPSTPNAQGLFGPVGLAIDSAGNLYVADSGNGRVLRFPAPFNQPQQPGTAPTANLVLGQTSFTAQVTDPTVQTMRAPYGIAFAADNGLLVSDAGLNRVLFFAGPAANFTNGMPASKVFGQPDFNSFGTGSGNNQMNSPKHVAIDSDDRLYVADEGNNRILIFDRAPTALNTNAGAGTILTGPSQGNNFQAPRGIFVSKITGEIWTSEANAGRLLRFPNFLNLAPTQNQSNFGIASNPGVAVTEDGFGDLFAAEVTNRIAVYFPGFNKAVNAANYLSDHALAPGVLVYAEAQPGLQFCDPSKNANANSAVLPAVLNDIQVLVNGSPAPIVYVYAGQLAFEMPIGAPASGNVELQAVRQSTGQILAVSQVPMAPVSPALFTQNSAGTGQVAALNEDMSVNTPSNPIGRGHVIQLFGTGQGVVSGAPPDGQGPAGATPTPQLPDVWINPAFVDPSNVQYSGLAPGLVGVWQINVKIPDSTVPSANVTIFVMSRSIPSSEAPQRTWISVKQ